MSFQSGIVRLPVGLFLGTLAMLLVGRSATS
jgi:hypothetical protein